MQGDSASWHDRPLRHDAGPSREYPPAGMHSRPHHHRQQEREIASTSKSRRQEERVDLEDRFIIEEPLRPRAPHVRPPRRRRAASAASSSEALSTASLRDSSSGRSAKGKGKEEQPSYLSATSPQSHEESIYTRQYYKHESSSRTPREMLENGADDVAWRQDGPGAGGSSRSVRLPPARRGSVGELDTDRTGDADFDEAIESLIRTRRELLAAAERSSKEKRARIQLRRKVAEKYWRTGKMIKSLERRSAMMEKHSDPALPPLLRRQQPETPAQPQQAQSQQAQPQPSPQQAQAPSSPAPPSQPTPAVQAATPATGNPPQVPGAAPTTANPAPATPPTSSITPQLEVSMEPTALPSALVSSAPMPSANSSLAAFSTPLPLLGAASSAPTTTGLAAGGNGGGTSHNVPFILIVSVGAAIVAATLIGGLAWMFRLSSSKDRVNKRKRLERGNWSPGAGSSVFSLREAEKVLLGGQSINSPMPALTGLSDSRRGKHTAPASHLEPMPVLSGRGWMLFDNPVPRRKSSVPSQDEEGQGLGLGLAPHLGDTSGFAVTRRGPSTAAEEREKDVDRDMHGIWPPATRRPSVMERLLHKRSLSGGLPLQHSHSRSESVYAATRRRSAFPLDQPSAWSSIAPIVNGQASETILFTDPFGGPHAEQATVPSRKKSTGMLSTLSNSLLKATRLNRREQTPSGADDTESLVRSDSRVITLGRRDSQLPSVRRLTKQDPRFKCDESTTTEEFSSTLAGSWEQESRQQQQHNSPAWQLYTPISKCTPGMAGIGSAFRTNDGPLPTLPGNGGHLCEVEVHQVAVPEPALMFEPALLRHDAGLQLSSLEQLKRQQELLAVENAAEQESPKARLKLEANIAKWQARSRDAEAPLERKPTDSSWSSSSATLSSASSASLLYGDAKGRRNADQLLKDRSLSSTTATTLFSPVTSISEGSSVSVRAAKARAAAATALNSWSTIVAPMPSSPSEGSAIHFDEVATEQTEEEKRGAISSGASRQRRAASKSSRATSATAVASSLFDKVDDKDAPAAEQRAARRRQLKLATARALRSEDVGVAATVGPDLADLAKEIDSMLDATSCEAHCVGKTALAGRTAASDVRVVRAHVRSRLTTREAHASSLASSDSDISQRRWSSAPGRRELRMDDDTDAAYMLADGRKTIRPALAKQRQQKQRQRAASSSSSSAAELAYLSSTRRRAQQGEEQSNTRL
ncbi:hypothetical protein K437DRAFT_31676 [Tilletiaria anomala UBC 951]|uniref:Uncharacterized protein n=1 Tax=Tilletiaria anomala (strain ATCC 24038 / CBS 436.72 / UBC 951) TaxID=1037660 RepID=A0A066V883_TILAU|nr:uncharacterized protein K437DRAFT_31676 [Tilletiaria anomala UBC 951]KDN37927.1 hypothetical protein K437DRAFT_31676 [Tilletiaria anomala UBC 951]